MIDSFNAQLTTKAQEMINTIIEQNTSLDDLKNTLGVEVNPKNEYQNKGTKIEILLKKQDILLPERKKYEDYYIDKENYSAIIAPIRNHLIATEILPKAIQKFDGEELIRDTIIWSLNANYFVSSGENFRNQGKSDITISFNDKSAFIAECKILGGSKYVS